MTQAENYEILFDGGNKRQAGEMAENMSIWKGQNWENEVTFFKDKAATAIYTSESEFRVATEAEIGQYK